MTRPIAPEVRFAKHRLLPEIGPAGQARLSASRFSIDPTDPAARFAAELLERSGLERADDAPRLIVAPANERGSPTSELDAAIRGALAAVEQIRAIVAVEGPPLTMPRSSS